MTEEYDFTRETHKLNWWIFDSTPCGKGGKRPLKLNACDKKSDTLDNPTAVFLKVRGKSSPTVNFVLESDPKLFNFVSAYLCLGEVVCSPPPLPPCLVLWQSCRKQQLSRLALTLVQARSFNNQVGWKRGPLARYRATISNDGERFFVHHQRFA